MRTKDTPVGRIFIPFKDLKVYGIPFSRVHLSNLIKQGRFPAPRQLSPNRVGWVRDELLEWAASLPAARSAEPKPPPRTPRTRLTDEIGAERMARQQVR